VQAILDLIRVMATTPYGSWKGCPHFGLRDFFEQARMRPDLPQLALQEINLALKDLGIVNFEVQKIDKEAQTNRDVDSYAVTIASRTKTGAGADRTYSVGISKG
jgi:hypothetical protein